MIWTLATKSSVSVRARADANRYPVQRQSRNARHAIRVCHPRRTLPCAIQPVRSHALMAVDFSITVGRRTRTVLTSATANSTVEPEKAYTSEFLKVRLGVFSQYFAGLFVLLFNEEQSDIHCASYGGNTEPSDLT